MKAYAAIVDALVAEGVTHVFGLMGDGNMLLMAEAARRPELGVTNVRHEGAALTMAVGYAVAEGSRGVGVSTVTCGPGLTQLGTALVDAVRRRTPSVVLAGDLASTDTHINQYFVQRPFVESTGAQYIPLTSAGDVAEVVASAFFRARTLGTTVVVGLPMHLQDEEYPWDWAYRPSTDALPDPASTPVLQPDPADIAALVELLQTAERPVLVAGAGAVAAGVADRLVQLAARTGALLATTLRAKGLFAGSPYHAGIAGAFSTGTARTLFAQADLAVGIGASLNYFTTEGGYLFPAAQVASIDAGDPRLRTELSLDLLVRGDAGLAVDAVLRGLTGPANTGFHTAEVADQLAHDTPVELRQPAEGLHPVDAVRELDQAMDEDAAFVVGVGHFWSFPIMYLSGRGPQSYHVTYDFGAIGQGLATAMGMATARAPRPTVLVEGDGSLLMHIQELETLRRSPTPLLVIVMNDGDYGAEVHKLRAKGLDTDGARFGSPDFAAIAGAFGVRGRLVAAPGELTDAVKEFLHDPRPTVVDARIDGSVVSAPYLRSVFGRDE
ncbi:MAG TPA: thiamine pyrophosphate-binding protein [Acidimicrobiales bacterium]|nr:thiamine pyrophosphate-binding protein [Acidimicrobiales bacterium]